MSTSAPPLTLVEFLTARLDELQAVAENADGETYFLDDGEYTGRLLEVMPADRVLADIEAKRAIIAEISDMLIVAPSGFGNDQVPINAAIERAAERARVLRLLASPYRDHPEWREDWS